MRKLEFYAQVDDQAGLIFNSPAMEQGGRKYFQGKKVKVTYEEDKGSKSEPSYLQYGYYFAVVVQQFWEELVQLGNDVSKDDAHDMLKLKFNPVYAVDSHGEIIGKKPGSTKKLSTKQFDEIMVEPSRRWLMEFFGCDTPEPDRNKVQQQIERERMAEERKQLRERKKNVLTPTEDIQ